MRISDNCYPVSGEELTSLAAEKNAFQWEVVVAQKITLDKADQSQIDYFLYHIRRSDKVSDFIKEKADAEVLEFYQLISPEGYLTNLGVLWLGTPAQRARINYPITL
jgi:ATP-dependent DNA helicase RecG